MSQLQDAVVLAAADLAAAEAALSLARVKGTTQQWLDAWNYYQAMHKRYQDLRQAEKT